MQESNNILVLDISLRVYILLLYGYNHSLLHLQSSMRFKFFTRTDDE